MSASTIKVARVSFDGFAGVDFLGRLFLGLSTGGLRQSIPWNT